MFFVLFLLLSLNVFAAEKAPSLQCELALMDLGRLKLETLDGKMPRAETLLVQSAYQKKIKELAENLNLSIATAEKIVSEHIQQNSSKLTEKNKSKETNPFNFDLEKVFKVTEATGIPNPDGIIKRPQTIEARRAREWFRKTLQNNPESLDNKYLQVLLSFAKENKQMDLLLKLDPSLFKYTPILESGKQPVEFIMGSSQEEKEMFYGNKISEYTQKSEIQHTVRLSEAYGLTQLISVGAWKIIENGKLPPGYKKDKVQDPKDEEPVRYISWNIGKSHIDKLNTKARELFGYSEDFNLFDFPTEAEWEYAARLNETGKPQKTAFSWGDQWEDTRGWGKDETKEATDYEGEGEFPLIGLKQPTEKGLSDMHNVLWQWCKDEFKEDYDGLSTLSINPGRNSEGDSRAIRSLRGSNVGQTTESARNAARAWDTPWDDFYLHYGLRLRQTEE